MPATNDNCVEKTVQSISMTKCIVRRSKRRRTSHSVRQSTTRRQLISVAIIIAIHFVEPAERTSSECLTESAQEPNAKREMQRRRKLVFLMKYKMPACHFACGVFPCIFRSVFFFICYRRRRAPAFSLSLLNANISSTLHDHGPIIYRSSIVFPLLAPHKFYFCGECVHTRAPTSFILRRRRKMLTEKAPNIQPFTTKK